MSDKLQFVVALGAQTRDVLKLVVGQGMTTALIGVAVEVAGAFALTRLLTSLLFSVTATDSITLILTGVALAACFVPARRGCEGRSDGRGQV